MNSHEAIVSTAAPPAAAFCHLRNSMGWGEISEVQAALCLQQSLMCASVYHQERLVAFGRVVGDGILFFYIQDVIVLPDFRGKGYGNAIMCTLEDYLLQSAIPGACIALLAVKGKEPFYQRYGYKNRDGEDLGYGMCKFVQRIVD